MTSMNNIGAAWTFEEEQRLYEATCRGESVHEMAEAHGRTSGGIRARQKHMGLRDEVGDLIMPTPEFRSALSARTAASRASRKACSERAAAHPLPLPMPLSAGTAVQAGAPMPPAASHAAQGWPADLPRGGDWVEKLWVGLRHDAEALRQKKKATSSKVEAHAVVLAHLTPDDDLHPSKTLAELGVVYGVTRERIRQIRDKSLRGLRSQTLKAGSLTKRVLDAMADAAPAEMSRTPQIWIATELAQGGCRRDFMEFVLTAALHGSEESPLTPHLLTSEAMAVVRARARVERPRRRRGNDGEAADRTEKADAFVRGILQKATWPKRLDGHPIDLSGMQPLRDCRSEQTFFSSTLRRHVGFDSQGELRLIRALDRGAMTTAFLEQPLEVPYEFEGESRSYFPDVLVRVDAELFFVIEIKARQRLADRRTLVKAKAAERHLGARGIGYCLTDADGFGLSDLRALERDEGFDQNLRVLLEENKPVKRAGFEKAFGGHLPHAYDLLQAAVLREGLRYETSLQDTPTGYSFDFLLSRGD